MHFKSPSMSQCFTDKVSSQFTDMKMLWKFVFKIMSIILYYIILCFVLLYTMILYVFVFIQMYKKIIF